MRDCLAIKSQHTISAELSCVERHAMSSRLCLRQLAAIALLTVSFVCAASASQSPKRVLLLYENQGAPLPAYMELESALLQTLRDQLGSNLDFYREEIDAERHPEDRAKTIAEIHSRYARRDIDVVICIQGADDALPGVPTVFVGNLPVELSETHGNHRPANAVWFELDLRKTVSLARKLQPEAHKVLVVSGASPLELFYLGEFHTLLKSMEPALEFEYVGNESVDQLLDRVAHLPRDTIVIPIEYNRDPAGNSYVPRDVIAKLAHASAAPVYAISTTYIGVGTVGGYVINWAKTGVAAADLALKLMGRSQPQIVVPPDGTSEYMFDWRELKRWGFSEKDLPPGSVIKYKVPTAWEQYRWRIVGTGVLVVAQFLLIGGLLIQGYRRRRAEESLRDMTGRVLQTQDDERRRIARDLHDGTGQQLSGIALSLGQVLADFPPGHERLRQLLQDSHVASRQALNEVRAVSYALHPPILDGLGLVPALHWYLDGLQKRTSFNIDFDTPAELAETSPDAQRTLFRIVQESVANVLRHSGGTALKVKLSDNGNGINLEIEDNGRGMSTEELERAESAASLGVGIAGMRERVRQLHGIFKIYSSPGGTRVFVSLPTHREHYAAHTAG
jgi:signal transduction histidine kinase